MINQLPNWNWQAVDVPDLAEIQQELLPLIEYTIPNWQTSKASFYSASVEKIKELSPRYVNLLKKLNLFDRWCDSGLATTNFQNDGCRIHKDDVDFNRRCFAFNIPLINCENTYTVWYDAVNLKMSDNINPDREKVVYYDESDAVEVERMPAVTCAFVNVSRPHRPVSHQQKFRAVLSSRFYPEIFDYFKSQ